MFGVVHTKVNPKNPLIQVLQKFSNFTKVLLKALCNVQISIFCNFFSNFSFLRQLVWRPITSTSLPCSQKGTQKTLSTSHNEPHRLIRQPLPCGLLPTFTSQFSAHPGVLSATKSVDFYVNPTIALCILK